MMKKPKYLGRQHQKPIATLDAVAAPMKGMVVCLDCSEFTSHCPVTSQPDFARIEIEYEADALIAETKSLKLWLWSWRNKKDFNEAIVAQIATQFFRTIKPMWVVVRGHFNARGGISVHPTATVRRMK